MEHLASRVSSPAPAPSRLASPHRTDSRTASMRRPAAGQRSRCPVSGCLARRSPNGYRPGIHVLLSPGHVSPDLPTPMARLGCRQPPGQTGTDPGGPPACGRARTCLPPAAARLARQPAPPRPPPAACPAASPRRAGRRGGLVRRDHGAAARRPAPPRSPAAGCSAGRPRRTGRRGGYGRRRARPARRPARPRPPPAGCPAARPRRPCSGQGRPATPRRQGRRGRRGRQDRGAAAR